MMQSDRQRLVDNEPYIAEQAGNDADVMPRCGATADGDCCDASQIRRAEKAE